MLMNYEQYKFLNSLKKLKGDDKWAIFFFFSVQFRANISKSFKKQILKMSKKRKERLFKIIYNILKTFNELSTISTTKKYSLKKIWMMFKQHFNFSNIKQSNKFRLNSNLILL